MIVLRTDKELAAMNCKKQGRFLLGVTYFSDECGLL
jgi:hypothetical protein